MYKIMSKLANETKYMWHDGEFYNTKESACIAACEIDNIYEVKILKTFSHGKNRLNVRFPKYKRN